MKYRIVTYCNCIIFLLLLKAQLLVGQSVANGVAYQTIVRNSSGLALLNQSVSIKLGIHRGSGTGLLVWEETFVKSTDSRGLLRVTIGNGTSTGAGSMASFSLISWSDNSYYLKVAIDIAGGSSFQDIGTAQLLSVPYAFYSVKTDALTNYYLDQLADVSVASPLVGKVNGTVPFGLQGTMIIPIQSLLHIIHFILYIPILHFIPIHPL